jgi:hypothetical protein
MKKIISASFLACFFLYQNNTYAQNNDFNISGNHQTIVQQSKENETIGAKAQPEDVMMNSFTNILVSKGKFKAGARFEYYNPPILGIDPNFNGSGIPYRFINFTDDKFDITIGNFYDQFGSGIIFRTYENQDLGYDNAMDGVRIKYSPVEGVYLRGMLGRQRYFWDKSPGIVRGIDGEVNVNDALSLKNDKLPRFDLGASFVSKYQENTNVDLNMPLNVGAYSLRFATNYKGFNADVEYAGKSQDPSTLNNYELSKGKALLLNAGYSTRGLGIAINAKHIDNMDFRSDRREEGQNLLINYNPAISRTQTWALATFFPYNANNMGEMGFGADVNYKISKKAPIIGGTYLNASYAKAFSINQTVTETILNPATASVEPIERTSKFFDYAKDENGNAKVLFREFYLEASKKINKKNKLTVAYMNTKYSNDLNSGVSTKDSSGITNAQTFVTEWKHKINRKNNIRFEVQYLLSDQKGGRSEGDWAMALVEYSTKKYFVAVQNLYNLGNTVDKVHFPTITAGINYKKSNIRATYGRQREGIFCVGGVCRAVPASDGLTVTLTANF